MYTRREPVTRTPFDTALDPEISDLKTQLEALQHQPPVLNPRPRPAFVNKKCMEMQVRHRRYSFPYSLIRRIQVPKAADTVQSFEFGLRLGPGRRLPGENVSAHERVTTGAVV